MQIHKFDPNRLTARDVLIIVPVVLGVTGLTIVFAFLVSDEVYIRWGGLAVDTTVLSAFFINKSRQLLRNSRFWLLTACLLIAHLAGWIVLLMHVEEWKLVWFTAMVLELPVFFQLSSRPNLIEPE